jgi:tRNA(Ser,Leu) C12 N-acetylase TAN1
MTGREDFKRGHATALVVTTAAGLEGEARRELGRLMPVAEAHPLVLKGNLLVLTDLPELEAIGAIREAETQCVSRVVPVQRAAPVADDPACFAAVATAACEVGRLRPGDTFLVRCRRRGTHEWASHDLERAVAGRLQDITGAIGEYEVETDWRVSVEVYQGVAYVGVNRPGYLLHKKLRRQRKYPPGERPLNRAQWKIREALAAFDIQPPPAARVLDLGSAPGGWAAELADLGAHVVAVDPADLDPEVTARANVRHLRCRAEDLAARADLAGHFDMLTADMNRDPAEAARILCQLAWMLKPGATAIMTVKYVTKRRRQHEREAREGLAAAYEAIRMRRLPHNAKETTAVMRRKGVVVPAPN